MLPNIQLTAIFYVYYCTFFAHKRQFFGAKELYFDTLDKTKRTEKRNTE